MSKVRVYEVAKQLNMDQKTLVALFQSMGIGDVRNHMSAVESDVVERVKRHLERQKAPEVVEERIRPTVVKRRARGPEGDAGVPSGPIEAHPPGSRPQMLGHDGRDADVMSARHAVDVSDTSRPSSAASQVRRRPPAAEPSSSARAVPTHDGGASARQPIHMDAPAAAPVPDLAAKPQERSEHTPEPAVPSSPAHPAPPVHAPEPSPVTSPLHDASAAPKRAAHQEGPAPLGTAEPPRAAPVEATAAPAGGPAAHAPFVEPGSPPVMEMFEPLPSKHAEGAVVTSAVQPTPAPIASPPAHRGPPSDVEAPKAPASPAPAVAEASHEAKSSTDAPQPSIVAHPAVAEQGRPEGNAVPLQSHPAVVPPPLAVEPAMIPAPPPAPVASPPPQADLADAAARPVAPPAASPEPASPPARSVVEPSAPPRQPPARPAAPGRPASEQAHAAHTRVTPRPTHERVTPTPQMASPATTGGAPRRPSQPPPTGTPQKTGIETWVGRPGVPMPQPRTGPPAGRRTVYDPRAAAPAQRPGVPAYGPGGGRGPQRPSMNTRGGPQTGFRGRQGTQATGPRKPSMVSTIEMASHKKVIKIEEQVTLQQLAAKMSVKATDVLMKLLSLGMTGVHINSTLDADTAKILAGEFGWSVEDVAVSEETVLEAGMSTDSGADVEQLHRPPIVTVMGHVDHGKTSLLDRIRKASVAEGEAGGITQHIGAYRVETNKGTIAFLDTPGHEAFTEMRARGAKVTDIVILVVAADDGVMPQTKEAIAHAQAAKVPIVVAVNKIDKPGAEPEKIKRDLSALGLQPEEWGGDTMFREVSAKTGQGIDELLESVLLQAEVLELKANPKKRASGTVIEALLDRGRGPVARVMVQDGTLHIGDTLLAGAAWGKVRAMTDELGRTVAEAGPATPVEVLGLNEVPSAGDPVHAVKDARTAEEIAETRRKKASKTLIPQDSRISLDTIADRLREADQLELKLIIKGDVQGSVEAVSHALAKLSAQKVKITIVHAGVGGITEGDVNLAVASRAILVGFNVRPAGKAASLAESEGVEIRLYNIIYNAVDDIHAAMEGLLPATKVEKSLGKAEVRAVFPIVKIGLVAGCMVLTGVIKRTADARLIRDSVVVWTGKLSGLRRFKDDAKEVQEGFECGISLENFRDIKTGDIVESFEIEEIKTKLT